MNPPQRYHALDNLRAIMMWLGIVLHVAVNHAVRSSPLPWRDRETSLLADFLLVFIHAFRMPVFFVLAGFFVAMLAARRGYGGMFRHRLRRIGLPFIVFWPPVFAGMTVLVLMYVHLMVRGTVGIDPAIMPIDPARPVISTMHMWFMYYLLWFCACTVVLGRGGRYLPHAGKDAVSRVLLFLISRWSGVLAMAIPLAMAGASYQWGVVTTSGSFIPQIPEFVHNGLFFVAGWHVYRHRHVVLALYSANCWRYAAAGLVFFASYLMLVELFPEGRAGIPYLRFWQAWIYGCVSLLWSFALIGCFLRYLPHQNPFLRYVAESSYWVYLVHMLGTIGVGVLLYDTPFNAPAKMAINILATTFACIVTYQVLVRHTPIGTLLSGRRIASGEKPRLGESASPV